MLLLLPIYSIWNHLVTLTQTEKITVIITTHYIEEARQANVVGLMRHGRLLAENSPEELLAQVTGEVLMWFMITNWRSSCSTTWKLSKKCS